MRTQAVIVVVLAVGTLFIGVPARQHSHAAGNRPHSHAHAHHVHAHHVHEHDVNGHDVHERGHGHEHDGVESSYAHVHVTLFGVDFTLPAESEDDQQQETRCTFLGPEPGGIEIDQSAAHFSVVAEPVFDCGEVLPMVATFRSIAASAAPLCDTARHERSGVLLI